MGQRELISGGDGREGRADGIARAIENEGDAYKAAFGRAFGELAALSPFAGFTAQDVKDAVGEPSPHHPNVIGALMRSLAVTHGLRKLRYVESSDPSRHRGAIAVWGRTP